MRKLLNTLYVVNPDSYLSLDGETVLVLRGEETVSRIPLHNLESIVTFGYAGASPALMGTCAKRNIGLCFLSRSGRFQCRVVGASHGNVLLRKSQYRISEDVNKSVKIARNFIFGKVHNSKWIIERAIRDHALRVDVIALKNVSNLLSQKLLVIKDCSDIEQLLGLEGSAATLYFSVIDQLVLQQKEDFFFLERSRRPPQDNVNALLSFAYTLLANDCAAALETVGLDAYVGFLHQDRPGRISLGLDIMEELRGIFADRLVITLINRKEVKASGFIKRENGSVQMSDETRKTVILAWQERKREVIMHPFLQEKIEWGLVPFVQASLLARFLRGDLDGYPPLLWK